ncbi:MAG: FtsW/RodA/SpoVE family cell cycle protein [Crocinitomicaceae bacterium]|nr:FtsW/RodA/SpoVE family cell cycle protein [Crocinitomicaceae bacterium]
MVKSLLNRLQGDRVIWMVTFFLSLMSILAVYSAISTLAYRSHGNSLSFLLKHSLMIIIGFVLMYVVHKIHFRYFSKLSQLLIWVAAGLLLFTLLFGSNYNSADRWIKIPGLDLTFQTSDFAKVVLMVYLARMLNQKRELLHDFRKGVVPVLLPVLVICGLILPANFSTAAMIGCVSLIIMFIAGVPLRHMGKLLLAAVAGILLIIAIGEFAPEEALPRYTTWKNRIKSVFNKESEGNYQADLAKYAIYEGGLIPKGPGTGTSRNFLPHPYSDMIYAFIIEEYGSLIGGIGLLLLYLILLFRTIRFSVRCPRHFGGLAALGLSFLLVFQAIINMGVAVSLFPTTGQPLPLVSMGGTSTLFTCLTIGIILSISRSVYNPEELEKADESRQEIPAAIT